MTTTHTPNVGDRLLVDLSRTVGQQSWIDEAGTSVVAVKVTQTPDASGCGFGRIFGRFDRTQGTEVLFMLDSVVGSADLDEPATVVRHRDGLVSFEV